MSGNSQIELSFQHPTDGRVESAMLYESMTGEQIIEDLIEQGFMKPAEEGYELFVKGGADISLDKPLSTQEVEEGDTIRVVPSSDAGSSAYL